MKKGIIIVGECILLIAVLAFIKAIIGGLSDDEIADHSVINFVFYFIAGMGSILIYRMNTKKK